jgi:WD40 repeat protein
VQIQPKQFRKSKLIWFLASVLLLVSFVFLYFQVWKKPHEVNSGIAYHHLTFKEHSNAAWRVEFFPDGEHIASGSVDGTAKIWRKNDAVVLQTLRHPMGVTALAVSPDGLYLATGSFDSIIRLWRTEDGSLIKTFEGHLGTVWAVAFSPNGDTIASGAEDSIVKLWNVSGGTLLHNLEGHSLNIWSIAFSPDGKTLASGSFDTNIKIWNPESGQLIRTISGHTQAVLSVRFSSDGKYLVSGGDDSTARLWNASDGSLMRAFQGESEHIYSAAISPDGKRLLTSGRDRNTLGELIQNFFGASKTNKWVTVRLWNIQDGTVIQTFAEHSNDVFSVAFSPDGQWFASGSEDKTVSLWRLTRNKVVLINIFLSNYTEKTFNKLHFYC